MTTRVRLVLPAVALGLLAPASFGQSVLYKFGGNLVGENLGRSVSGTGDVNADGFDDVIVGSIEYDSDIKLLGRAQVFSGKDGSVLYTFDGESENNWFAKSVSGAGDVNGDGFPDLIVGAPFATKIWPPLPPKHFGGKPGDLYGSATVFSGKDGSTLHSFYGDRFLGHFGRSVSDAGDTDGDGFDDVIVGSPRWRIGDGMGQSNEKPGRARVFSGKDGSALLTFFGDSFDSLFGASVSGAGDVNGDRYADVIVGANGDNNNGPYSGSARVFSGVDGSVLYTFLGDSAGDNFGFSVSRAGDVDGDGFDDVIVGAVGDEPNGARSGSARVFSGLDGSILYTFEGDSAGDRFGFSVSGAGDLNGDGFADLIVGARQDDNNGTDSGSVRVLSGKGGSVLYSIEGQSEGDFFGESVSGAGDVNGDGIPDLIVGAPNDLKKDKGRAWVFSGCGFDGVGTNYCGPANLNSIGQPAVIEALGSEVVVANCLRLTALQLPTQQFGYFLNSQTQGFVPFAGGSQGNLCLAGAIGRYNRPGEIQNSGAGGTYSLVLDLTDTPQPTGSVSIMAGETWNFQAWFRDNNPGPTSNFTDGVSITFL